MNKDTWTVYCHTNKINNKKYIGITSQNPKDRWNNGKGYGKSQTYFYNAIQKYGWDNFEHDILYTNLNKDEACKKEIELIALHNTTNKDYGYNISLGGTAPMYGRKHNKETLKNYSDKRKGSNNSFYGKHHTEKTKNILKQNRLGKKTTQEVKDKISRGLNRLPKGKDNPIISSHFKPITQYDLQGNLIKEWDYIKEASIIYDDTIKKNISKCCRGIVFNVYGYVWRYKGDSFNKYPTVNPNLYTPITQYSKKGKIIKEWEDIKDIPKHMNIKIPNIRECCNGTYKTSKGYVWRYKNEPFNKYDTSSDKHCKPVAQYSLDGKLIKIWDSATEIERELGYFHGNIGKCCLGKYKTSNGYIWKFYDKKAM